MSHQIDDTEALIGEVKGPKVNWKRLFIFLAIGAVPTAISFIFGWWWGGTAYLLLTLLAACFAFARDLYPTAFTLYAVLAIAWLSGSLLDTVLPTEWDLSTESRIAISAIVGVLLGIVIPMAFWFVVLFVSTKWIMSVSESFDVSWWQAFKFVATRSFEVSSHYLLIENGRIVAGSPSGLLLSQLRGPGVLEVHPGNVVVLERGGQGHAHRRAGRVQAQAL